jgi:hypothetical protein
MKRTIWYRPPARYGLPDKRLTWRPFPAWARHWAEVRNLWSLSPGYWYVSTWQGDPADCPHKPSRAEEWQ